jgi:hypothetical protein
MPVATYLKMPCYRWIKKESTIVEVRCFIPVFSSVLWNENTSYLSIDHKAKKWRNDAFTLTERGKSTRVLVTNTKDRCLSAWNLGLARGGSLASYIDQIRPADPRVNVSL